MNAYAPHAYTIPCVDAIQTEMAPLLHLAPVGHQAVDRDVDGGLLASDAGLRLRKAPEEQRGFTRALAAVRKDPRDPRRGHCPWPALRTQRVVHMAAGSEEAHDATPRRHAPLFTRLLARFPATAPPWASQPTRARCETPVARTALSRMARVLVEQCRASYARPPQRIVLDCDDPEAPGHGAQAPARYESYAGGSCCLPRPLYAGLSGRLSTTLVTAQRFTGTPRLSGLQRLGKRRRHAWPDTLVIVRGARPCASPEVMPWREAPAHRSDGTGVPSHAVLPPLAHAGASRPNGPRSAMGARAPASPRRVPRLDPGRAHAAWAAQWQAVPQASLPGWS